MKMNDSIYVYGEDGIRGISQGNVLIVGSRGLGAEIAKNLCLMGVKSITLQDNHIITNLDVGTNIFVTEAHLEEKNKNKHIAEITAQGLSLLNPHVTTNFDLRPFPQIPNEWFSNFSLVIITHSIRLSQQCRINNYCRSIEPPIPFIMTNVRGLFSWIFVDFGQNYFVQDVNCEYPQQAIIAHISNEKDAVVTCVEHHRHGFVDGDIIEFSEIQGMNQLNNMRAVVQIIDPYSFRVNIDTSNFGVYISAGIAIQKPKSQEYSFNSLEKELESNRPRLARFVEENEEQARQLDCYLLMRSLDSFEKKYYRTPAPWNLNDSIQLEEIAKELNQNYDEKLLKQFSFSCGVHENGDPVSDEITSKSLGLSGITSFIGAIASLECLKYLSNKFIPLQQWFFFEISHLFPSYYSNIISNNNDFIKNNLLLRNERDDIQRICLGNNVCKELSNLKIFQIGVGTIGCENLKNFCLMNIGIKGNGNKGGIIITDNDFVEQRNFNNQFLFNSLDISLPKSVTAAKKILEINHNLRITAHEIYVGKESEEIFTKEFMETIDCIIPAVDNLKTRRYLDSQSILFNRPMIDSGISGNKGHVQTVIPKISETWSAVNDSPEKDFPLCIVKSFPYIIQHSVFWAKEKFSKSFYSQIRELQNVFDKNTRETTIQKLVEENRLTSLKRILKHLNRFPKDFGECVAIARNKFQKYFHNDILQLLFKFPSNHIRDDQTRFWAPPKREPSIVLFDEKDSLHFDFIKIYSILLSDCLGIERPSLNLDNYIIDSLRQIVLPEFRPDSDKVIITDPNVSQNQNNDDSIVSDDSIEQIKTNILELLTKFDRERKIQLTPQLFNYNNFEKHVELVYVTANLRARTYHITEIDKLTTARISGDISPNLITSSAAVSGLVSIELIKLCKLKCGQTIEKENYDFKNYFFNLCLPFITISSPSSPIKNRIQGIGEFTVWDQLIVDSGDLTIEQFCSFFDQKYNLEVSGIFHEAHIVFMGFSPVHCRNKHKRLVETLSYIPKEGKVNLVVSFEDKKTGEDMTGPTVCYIFQH
eukprot:c9920_g1_i1.p1 GENE.c9920_g1_i1~~c9920_g1_i1.p1  ORF type:complete len:1052 (+),score=401.65 c9920_g1_i1:32-3157(+)